MPTVKQYRENPTIQNKELLKNPSVQAMLKTIRYAEGTAGDRGYNTRVGYSEFDDLSKKPGKKVFIPSINDFSSAEGAYQFLNSTWDGVSKKLGLKDFSPESQDLAAIELIKNRGALDDVLSNNLSGALTKLSGEWASLPTASGKSAYKNQNSKKVQDLSKVFFSNLENPKQNEDVVATTAVSQLQIPIINSNFAGVSEPTETDTAEKEDKQPIKEAAEVKQQTNEYNFLKDYQEQFAQQQEQQPIEIPTIDVEQTVNEVSQFVDSGIVAQQGRQKLDTGHYKTTTGKVVVWGTPEYREAYDRGEVVTDKGVKSPVTMKGQKLDEVVIQNNYKRGFWEKYKDKIVEENKGAGVLGAIVGAPLSAVASLPQLAMMEGLTGKMQRPSEAMNIQNPYGAMAVDAVTDPANLIGAGVLTKEKALARLAASTEDGLLSNAYKYNPFAFKADPKAYYRMLGDKGFEDAKLVGELRPKQRTDSYGSFPETYYSKGKLFEDYGNAYIAEVKNTAMNHQPLGYPFPVDDYAVSVGNIKLENPNVSIYKKDWLQGYKQVEVPKSNLNHSGIFDEEGISDFMQILKNKKEADKAIEIARADLTDPETIRRASELGIDPELLQQASNNMTYTAQNSTPSSFSSGDFTININPKQIGRSRKQEMVAEIMGDLSPNFTANEIAAHEVGHVFQNTPLWKEGYKKTAPNDIKKMLSFDIEENKKIRDYWENYSTRDAAPTKVDELLGDIDFKEGIDKDSYANKNRSYFENANNKYGTNVDNKIERLPMFREYRQGMRDLGILKNKWDEITPEMVDEYAKIKPENRLNSFMDFNDKNKELIRQVSRIAPAAIPLMGASYLTTQGQEPKKFQQGGTAEQKDQEWLQNWYANRVIPNKYIQGAYLEDKPTYLERLKNIPPVTKVNMIDNNPNKTGQYNDNTGELLLTPKAQPSVYTHEVNHYLNQFPSTMRTVHENIVEQNMYKKGDPRLGVNNEHYDYLRNPDEIHSRLQVLRKDAGFKPNEEVTQEKLLKYLQNYKGNDENILQIMNLTDEKGLLDMLNYMADSSKSNGKVYAQNGGIKIVDNRKINATTGKKINPNIDLVSDNYDRNTVQKIIKYAGKHKVDPLTALAIDLQETGFGKTEGNIGHLIGRQDIEFENFTDPADAFVRVLKSKQNYAKKLGIKDENTIIQTYNGLGKVYPQTEQDYHGFKMKKIYGVDVPKTGIDMKKNPLYGKRIIDLRDNVLRQNSEVINEVNGIINPFSGRLREDELNQHLDLIIPRNAYLPTLSSFDYNSLAQKKLFQQGGKQVIEDNLGYWNPKNIGRNVKIDGGNITMEGVDQPLIGKADTGETKLMMPNQKYTFAGAKNVVESPLTKEEQMFLEEYLKYKK